MKLEDLKGHHIAQVRPSGELTEGGRDNLYVDEITIELGNGDAYTIAGTQTGCIEICKVELDNGDEMDPNTPEPKAWPAQSPYPGIPRDNY